MKNSGIIKVHKQAGRNRDEAPPGLFSGSELSTIANPCKMAVYGVIHHAIHIINKKQGEITQLHKKTQRTDVL